MRRAAAILGLVLAMTACTAPGHAPAELPEAPLAFTYLDETEAKDRAKTQARTRREKRDGTAHLDDLEAYLGLGPRPDEKLAHLGRLAFLDVRTGDITLADFALPGARPLDWSPDGERLLFVSQRDGRAQIYEWVRETGVVRAATRGSHSHPSASYGPDGRIAYLEVRATPRGSHSRVLVTAPGGGRPQAVSAGPADGRPAWSPDGKRLIYEVAPHSPGARLALLDLGSPEPRLVARGRSPVFTPDGQWVVYSARVRDGWRLRRMRPDGSGKIGFESRPGNEHAPAVSPDGRFVTYVYEEEGRYRLRMRALDGRGDRPLLNHGDGFTPAWN